MGIGSKAFLVGLSAAALQLSVLATGTPLAVAQPSNSISGFSINNLTPNTFGTLMTTFTVPSYSDCPAEESGPLISSTAQLEVSTFAVAKAIVAPNCDSGIVDNIAAYVQVGAPAGAHQAPLAVSAGDTVKVTITDHAPNPDVGHGALSATIQNLTAGTQAEISKPQSAPLFSLTVGEEMNSDIPTFGTVRFTNTFFQGTPFAAALGLTKSEVINRNGKPMVQVTGPSPDGKSFTTLFRRNGVWDG